jgi:hypothetical protein
MNQHHHHSTNLFNQQPPTNQQNLMMAINNMVKCKYFKVSKTIYCYFFMFKTEVKKINTEFNEFCACVYAKNLI